MFRSSRFRDIFSAKPIAIRGTDRVSEASGSEAISDAEFGRRADELEVDMIWLGIADAHRRAARTFTPTRNRAVDLAE